MVRRSIAVLLFVLVPALAAQAQDVKKSAEEFGAKWASTYNRGDAHALATLFTEDGVFNAPSGAVIKGREAIEKALTGRMKAGWTTETVTTTEAGAAGTAIWATGDYGLVGSGEVAGKQSGGHFGWVLVPEGGAWHVAMLTANVKPQQ
jgi:uncharacterized protein (TIGR02246 family)